MGKLIADKISISYGHKNILSNVTYTFKTGFFYLIQGQSGIGKTSLINILGLLRKPKAGQVKWNNISLWNLNKESQANFRNKNIGFVFQQNNLIENLSVKDNILLPLLKGCKSNDEVKDKLNEIVDFLQIKDLLTKLPKDLSGGEEQRVAIARALISDSEIILADEPTSSLDKGNTCKIYSLLQMLANKLGKLVIVVSHETLPEEYADIILNIKDKQLVERNVNSKKVNSKSKISNVVEHNPCKFSIKRANIYDLKLKKNRSILSIILSFIVVLLITLSSLIFILPSVISSEQQKSFSSVIDKSIFLVNDVAKINTPQDLDSYKSFSKTETKKIKNKIDRNKIYPFIEFTSYGITPNNIREAVPKSYHIKINSNNYIIKDDFSIQPIYPEDRNKKYLFEKGKPQSNENNFIISEEFLVRNNIPSKHIIGKTITINAYVPFFQYITDTQLPNNNNKVLSTDGNIYKTVIIKRKVTGVYKVNYPYHRSEQGNAFFMDYSIIHKIQKDIINKNKVKNRIFKSFKQKEWAPSAYVIFAKDAESIRHVINVISNISPNFKTYSTLQNLDNINKQVSQTRQTVYKITVIIIFIVLIILYVIFAIKDKQRIYEFGIIKCLGFSDKDISKILIINSVKIGSLYAVCSIVLLLIIYMGLVFSGFVSGIFFLLLGVFIVLILSYILTTLTSLLPMLKIKNIDPIDIINESKIDTL